MKKNWTMRVALLIVALALITSCFVSGTYAKYITGTSATDTARVAQFGVTITADGTLFDTTYLAADDNTPGNGATTGITVKSSNTDNLVAPGTKNEDGMTFEVTGQPEVDVTVLLTVGDDFEEIFLKEGEYADMTGTDDTFTLAEDYYPVQFTLAWADGTEYTGTIAEIKAQLEASDTATVYPAGTDLSTAIGTITLTWEWAFGDEGAPATGNDFADTFLGDLAAGTVPTASVPADGNYNLTETVDISLYIVQVD